MKTSERKRYTSRLRWQRIKDDPILRAKKIEYLKKYYQLHKEEIRAKKSSKEELSRKRVWSNANRLKKLEELAGRSKPVNCDICGNANKIMYDHDHSTGSFRGWICLNCNAALGHCRDNPAVLYKLIEYLEKSKNKSNQPVNSRYIYDNGTVKLNVKLPK